MCCYQMDMSQILWSLVRESREVKQNFVLSTIFVLMYSSMLLTKTEDIYDITCHVRIIKHQIQWKISQTLF